MFQGKFEHSIDDKGRLALPAAFRHRLNTAGISDGVSESSVMVTISDQCLAAYPLADWEMRLAQLTKLSLSPQVVAFKRIFIGCAQECSIDKAGRILIPMDLRREAKLHKECVILGQLEKFELWAAERWQASFSQPTEQIGSLYEALAASGIQI